MAKNREGENWKTKIWRPINPSHLFCISQPYSGSSSVLSVPVVLPLILVCRLDQRSGTLPPFTGLLPGHPVRLCFTWKHAPVLPAGQLLLQGLEAPCASHHRDVHSLCYNGLLVGLDPTFPGWERSQVGEHVFFTAELQGHTHHTINLFIKWTNHWIHPLPSTEETEVPTILIDYTDSSWSYCTHAQGWAMFTTIL